jgi:peptidoglycan/LPS O-acetylase OafA/YrhL
MLVQCERVMQKVIIINAVGQFCTNHNIDLTSAPALLGVELCVYIVATILFLTVERPFLQLRHRIARRELAAARKGPG